MLSTDTVDINSIKVNDRIRQSVDEGALDALVRSIKEFGIIQPIVLQRNGTDSPILVAGGRRLAAMQRAGFSVLSHGKEFIWRDEDLQSADGVLRLQAMELEENLKRQDLHWSETIAAKLRLYETMQSIHGTSKGFGAGRSGVNDGFSIRRLAEMLGENPSTTSRDLDLAGYVINHPKLAALPSRSDAQRMLGVAMTTAMMQKIANRTQVSKPSSAVGPISSVTASGGSSTAAATGSVDDATSGGVASLPGTQSDPRWVLYEGKFQDNIGFVASNSVDLVLTDLPYGIGVGDHAVAHGAGLGRFVDSGLDISQLVNDVAVESYRVLRDDRFGVFFYGMAYHQLLYEALTAIGFVVDVYPFIWIRDRTAPPDGFARYSKTYDPALIASKGKPRFIRPNLPNSIAIPSVRGVERLHSAQKPFDLMEKFVLDMTTEQCVVLDMFAGAGTTGAAALKNKRKAILFELEKPNCILIKSRLGVL